MLSYPILYKYRPTITVVLNALKAPPGHQPVVARNRGNPDTGYCVIVRRLVSIIAIAP